MPYYIYKLCCDDCDDFYVGSTKSIKDRKYAHKSVCNHPNNKDYNQKMYVIIRENGGWDNWRMVCLEECDETVTKRQAEMKEEEYRLELKATMNSKCAYRTQAQYQIDNSEKIKKYKAQYQIDNSEKIKAQKAQYRIDNSEKIKAQASEKITCECGSIIVWGHFARHKKSAKHCKFSTNKN